jgi:hypothetical protein
MKCIAARCFFAILVTIFANQAVGQVAPEIGYMHPAGGQAGTTVDVKLGGYDWTPDMQIFVHDPRVKLEIVGPPTGVLVPEPPYWFGAKARGNDRPLPREFPAKLTIPADVPSGLIRFQVANANGASPPGWIHVGSSPDVAEDQERKTPQLLAALPITVNGRIQRIEEIDRYEFAPSTSGPISIELIARRLASPLHALMKVIDANGKVVVDKADTEGRDFAITFIAQAGIKYQIALHDLDYAGDRAYVYRLGITPGPRVLAAYPAAGKPGETKEIEFLGIGLATGANQVESLKKSVTFPNVPGYQPVGLTMAGRMPCPLFDYVLESPAGKSLPCPLGLSQLPEQVKPAGTSDLALPQLPCAVTASIATRFGSDRYALTLKKDEKWKFTAFARAIGSPLDVDLVLLDAAGKEVARSDDMPGTTDPLLLFAAPADGAFTLVVTDWNGASGSREANYRLTIEPQVEDFAVILPPFLPVVLGTTVKLPLKIERMAGFKAPIAITVAGLPAGITVPPDLKLAEGAVDLPLDLICAADAAATASLVTFTATSAINGQPVTRTSTPVLIASIMKPRVKLTPEGLDDVRKVHRGSTYLAPVFVDRLEGYAGDVVLEMTAKQQRTRQGMTSGEFTVKPGERRVEYPIFIPEWMETTKTSRMILNGAVKLADPKGNVRTLLSRMELRIGVLPEGALMKLGHTEKEISAAAGAEVKIPLTLFRAGELKEDVKLELVPPALPAGLITCEPVTLEPGAQGATMIVRLASNPQVAGEQTLQFRATALKDGKWPVISETSVLVIVPK